MTSQEFVRRFVVVHKCAGCGEILDYDNCDEAFCKKCYADYNVAKTESCGKCYRVAKECVCMSKELSKSGALCHRKLFFYDTEQQNKPHIKLLYYIKNIKSRRVSGFVARELLPLIMDEVETLSVPRENFLFTYSPRSKRSLARAGFDQSEMIIKSLSDSTGISYARIFAKKLGNKEQKNLGKIQRVKNAEKYTKRVGKVSVVGKYVILVDDIVTTGASMAICVKALMKEGALGVLCFSIAVRNEK